MIDSKKPIGTSRYLDRIMLPQYHKGSQLHSHECFLYILDKLYPVIDRTCDFKISINASINCDIPSCQNVASNNVQMLPIVLNIWNTVKNTVTELLNNYLAHEHIGYYKCDHCSAIGSC